MMRDEADVVRHTVEWMQTQVDKVIVADNGSVDDTRSILEELGVTVVDDPEVGYYQSEKMSALAHRAFHEGASWVVPFDADELWLAREGRIADFLESLPDTVMLAQATLFDHVATGLDPDLPDPVERIKWRRPLPGPLHKVACRAHPQLWVHQGNHGAGYPNMPHPPAALDALVIHHFPYRSVEQFESKVRNGAQAYSVTRLGQDIGAHWRQYGRILEEQGPEALAEVFREWFWAADPQAAGLIYDPV